jgi:hypothetical protein
VSGTPRLRTFDARRLRERPVVDAFLTGSLTPPGPNAGASGLTDDAYRGWQYAQTQTTWGHSHLSRLALADGNTALASATRRRFSGVLDGEPVRVCALGDLTAVGEDGVWMRQLVEDAIADSDSGSTADVILLYCAGPMQWHGELGFHEITPSEVYLAFPPNHRPGTPMLSVRAGEDLDIPAIASMEQTRFAPFRFQINRDVAYLRHNIVAERLLAGLRPVAAQELHFFVTEEGKAAAAFVIIRVCGDDWTVLQCGDRDPSGARVGGIIQALIARDPVGPPSRIHGWLPPGFTPPQARRVSITRSSSCVMAALSRRHRHSPPLRAEDSPTWKSDCI